MDVTYLSEILTSFHELTAVVGKNKRKLIWSTKPDAAFLKAKDRLAQITDMKAPNFNQTFFHAIDASNIDVWASISYVFDVNQNIFIF